MPLVPTTALDSGRCVCVCMSSVHPPTSAALRIDSNAPQQTLAHFTEVCAGMQKSPPPNQTDTVGIKTMRTEEFFIEEKGVRACVLLCKTLVRVHFRLVGRGHRKLSRAPYRLTKNNKSGSGWLRSDSLCGQALKCLKCGRRLVRCRRWCEEMVF